MLLDKLERINRLRKEAMNNPEFLKAAQEHQKALEHADKAVNEAKKRQYKSRAARSLSDIYQGVDVGQHESTHH
ncbi:hypothetical protein ACPV5L_05655 [Vibrio astriarenae]|jgi:hypothetical protein|uniref:Uncharacterized protein n=1 Tax=Vibrio agarivorans TaxID=153622 RepID=A0ABT7Y083_9VIBR|nr:hypothetical protein [Vibrio agarivorans]MDN2481449.1 hypothetical protein [Vibrio agarivorans]MDN3663640.1 hypothetical protein [Vibrio agarivorans]